MNRYSISKVVGKGSFGKALLCRSRKDGRACIIKQVDTAKLNARERREAQKEAALLSTMRHPNIVGYWESFFDGPSQKTLCIVMDYADGGDLYGYLKGRKGVPLAEERVIDWFVQITLALKHIHDRKILHRDLKTQNIFLTLGRVVKLGDFGIAKVLSSTMDHARTAIGTPYYMSPEICQERRYNHKSDMWSLGCVLYEMAALKHAFEGSDMRQLVVKICRGQPTPISSTRYSAALRSLISDLLKKEPHDRPNANAVLRKPLIHDRISNFLNQAQLHEEFSHTVLHGKMHDAVVTPVGFAEVRQVSSSVTAASVSVSKHNAEAAKPTNVGIREEGIFHSNDNARKNSHLIPSGADVKAPVLLRPFSVLALKPAVVVADSASVVSDERSNQKVPPQRRLLAGNKKPVQRMVHNANQAVPINKHKVPANVIKKQQGTNASIQHKVPVRRNVSAIAQAQDDSSSKASSVQSNLIKRRQASNAIAVNKHVSHHTPKGGQSPIIQRSRVQDKQAIKRTSSSSSSSSMANKAPEVINNNNKINVAISAAVKSSVPIGGKQSPYNKRVSTSIPNDDSSHSSQINIERAVARQPEKLLFQRRQNMRGPIDNVSKETPSDIIGRDRELKRFDMPPPQLAAQVNLKPQVNDISDANEGVPAKGKNSVYYNERGSGCSQAQSVLSPCVNDNGWVKDVLDINPITSPQLKAVAAISSLSTPNEYRNDAPQSNDSHDSGSWLQNLEARMGAVRAVVDVLKSPQSPSCRSSTSCKSPCLVSPVPSLHSAITHKAHVASHIGAAHIHNNNNNVPMVGSPLRNVPISIASPSSLLRHDGSPDTADSSVCQTSSHQSHDNGTSVSTLSQQPGPGRHNINQSNDHNDHNNQHIVERHNNNVIIAAPEDMLASSTSSSSCVSSISCDDSNFIQNNNVPIDSDKASSATDICSNIDGVKSTAKKSLAKSKKSSKSSSPLRGSRSPTKRKSVGKQTNNVALHSRNSKINTNISSPSSSRFKAKQGDNDSFYKYRQQQRIAQQNFKSSPSHGINIRNDDIKKLSNETAKNKSKSGKDIGIRAQKNRSKSSKISQQSNNKKNEADDSVSIKDRAARVREIRDMERNQLKALIAARRRDKCNINSVPSLNELESGHDQSEALSGKPYENRYSVHDIDDKHFIAISQNGNDQVNDNVENNRVQKNVINKCNDVLRSDGKMLRSDGKAEISGTKANIKASTRLSRRNSAQSVTSIKSTSSATTKNDNVNVKQSDVTSSSTAADARREELRALIAQGRLVRRQSDNDMMIQPLIEIYTTSKTHDDDDDDNATADSNKSNVDVDVIYNDTVTPLKHINVTPGLHHENLSLNTSSKIDTKAQFSNSQADAIECDGVYHNYSSEHDNFMPDFSPMVNIKDKSKPSNRMLIKNDSNEQDPAHYLIHVKSNNNENDIKKSLAQAGVIPASSSLNVVKDKLIHRTRSENILDEFKTMEPFVVAELRHVMAAAYSSCDDSEEEVLLINNDRLNSDESIIHDDRILQNELPAQSKQSHVSKTAAAIITEDADDDDLFAVNGVMSQEYLQMLINMQEALDHLDTQSDDSSMDTYDSKHQRRGMHDDESNHSIHLSDSDPEQEPFNNNCSKNHANDDILWAEGKQFDPVIANTSSYTCNDSLGSDSVVYSQSSIDKSHISNTYDSRQTSPTDVNDAASLSMSPNTPSVNNEYDGNNDHKTGCNSNNTLLSSSSSKYGITNSTGIGLTSTHLHGLHLLSNDSPRSPNLSNTPHHGLAMTVMGIPLRSDIQAALGVKRGDSASHRIEALRVYLENQLGLEPFLLSYRYLKRMGNNSHDGYNDNSKQHIDDAAVTDELERLMGGTDRLKHLPVLLQLIAVEERFDEL